jgi:hypothetical protein
MKRLLFIMMAASTGCMHIEAVGPLAEAFPNKASLKDAPLPEPIVKQAGKPTPPALYVTPAEITSANAAEAVKRLQQELDTDRRSLEAMPKYSEVSKVK